MEFQYRFTGKKEVLKAINDLNQIVKKLYTRYIIIRDKDLIVPDKDGLSIDKGTHFATSKLVTTIMDIFPDDVTMISLDAGAIFTIIKEEKSNIDGIMIHEGGVFFIMKDAGRSVIIGSVKTDIELSQLTTRTIDLSQWVLGNLSFNYSDRYVDNLMDKELVILRSGDKKARITKELIPNLTKKTVMAYEFTDELTNNTNTFNLIISMEKGSVYQYHIYTCFHY